MRQNERVQAVINAKDPIQAFSRAQELALGDFVDEAKPTEKTIKCEVAAREAIEGICEKCQMDRLPVLQVMATMVARLTAVELTCPSDQAEM